MLIREASIRNKDANVAAAAQHFKKFGHCYLYSWCNTEENIEMKYLD